jgi:pSer/pThr/pTyr-binding forkhead associated (FHA) protein
MDDLVLKEIALGKERTTIGRKPHNDIQIDNLAISGEHAVVITILNDSFLEDMGSTNGTFVNGQSVKKHFLQSGDTIELGKYRLKYINDTPQQASSADFEKTMILRPGAIPKPAEAMSSVPPVAHPMPAAPPPTAAPPALPLGAIQILSGGNAGKEMELTKTLTTLGKPGVQVAVIARRPHGYFITHVEGANFPVVNGTTLDNQAHPLNDHDIIELAGIKMEFFLKA